MIGPDDSPAITGTVLDEDGPFVPDEPGESVANPDNPYLPDADATDASPTGATTERELVAVLGQNGDGPEDATRRRVRKLTPALKRKVCQAIAAGASPTSAAKAVGLSRSALYYQRKNDPEFREAWDEAREIDADSYEDALRESAHKQKNIGAIIFGLKNKRAEKWKDTHEVVDRRSVNVSISYESLPPAQREALIALLSPDPSKQLTEGAQEGARDGTDA